MAWQIERSADEWFSFEKLNNIVFALSSFSWSLFSVNQSRHAGLESFLDVVMLCYRQRIDADRSIWIGSVKEIACTAQRELGLAQTPVAPHSQFRIA